jgi:DNA-binding CsgD family transcriptional regulator
MFCSPPVWVPAARQPADFLPDKGLSVMENILQAQKDIDAVYTHDDDMAEGVVAAIENEGREGEMFLTGAGGSKAAMERIKAGGLYRATFLYNPSMSSSAINLARLIAQGSGLSDLAERGAEQDHGDGHHRHQGQRGRSHGHRLLDEDRPAGRPRALGGPSCFAASPTPDQPLEPLTAREEEVLVKVAQGRTNAEIADELYISLSAAKTHLAGLMTKLGARNRVELAIWTYETDRLKR